MELVTEFAEVFAEQDEIGVTDLIKFNIELQSGSQPIK